MSLIQVKFSHENKAFARKYYRTLGDTLLLCLQEDYAYLPVWYWCSEHKDQEPEYPVDLTKVKIEIVEKTNGISSQ